MKTINKLLIIILGITLVHCGSSGGSGGGDLEGGTYTLVGFEEIDASINEACGSFSYSSSATGGTSTTNKALHEEAKKEVTFFKSEFMIQSGGFTLMNGTWKKIDGNTIEVKTSSITALINYSIDGDVLTLEIPSRPQFSCGSGSSSGSGSGSDGGTVEDTSQPIDSQEPVDSENWSNSDTNEDDFGTDSALPTSTEPGIAVSPPLPVPAPPAQIPNDSSSYNANNGLTPVMGGYVEGGPSRQAAGNNVDGRFLEIPQKLFPNTKL